MISTDKTGQNARNCVLQVMHVSTANRNWGINCLEFRKVICVDQHIIFVVGGLHVCGYIFEVNQMKRESTVDMAVFFIQAGHQLV